MNTIDANELLKEVSDIIDLSAIDNWPLAMGWWVLILTGVIFLTSNFIFFIRNKKYKSSWSYALYKMLTDLEKKIEKESKKYILTELSKILRIIAVKRYSRSKCASLVGYEWLKWLSFHDPKKFSWTKRGKILISGPYTRESNELSKDDEDTIRELIKAAKEWVKI